jgi:glutamate synthase (ferredoxin)
LPEGTITFALEGAAGQSLGAFLPKGISLLCTGDANDYVGKGLSGGTIAIAPHPKATFLAHENVIAGNVALYGATGGRLFVRGLAGERFAVRNSGASAVVEGIGDHGCEYMTGGRVVVLGRTGKNFGAGMTGGYAYVLDLDEAFASRCNLELIALRALDEADEAIVRELVTEHVRLTQSERGAAVLARWDEHRARFRKVVPIELERVERERRQLPVVGAVAAE